MRFVTWMIGIKAVMIYGNLDMDKGFDNFFTVMALGLLLLDILEIYQRGKS